MPWRGTSLVRSSLLFARFPTKLAANFATRTGTAWVESVTVTLASSAAIAARALARPDSTTTQSEAPAARLATPATTSTNSAKAVSLANRLALSVRALRPIAWGASLSTESPCTFTQETAMRPAPRVPTLWPTSPAQTAILRPVSTVQDRRRPALLVTPRFSSTLRIAVVRLLV